MIRHLSKYFDGVLAVDDISFDISQGTITALIGPNGAGKTTVFNLLSGTIEADHGKIALAEIDLTRCSVEARARRGFSRTFQLSRPFRNLTVCDHLLLARKSQSEEDMRASLERVGLTISLDAKAADLSYGQNKLLGIAMALAHPHTILLFDEPVAGVNPVIRDEIASLLQRLRAAGETILLIEHDMAFVMALADRVIVMDRGRIIAEGNPEDVKKDPAVLGAYLGAQL